MTEIITEQRGIDTLYSFCGKNDGFNVIRQPDQLQSAYIEILEQLARDIFGDLICYKQIPECRVIINPQAPNEGLADTWRTTNVRRNILGLKVVRFMRWNPDYWAPVQGRDTESLITGGD